MTPKIQFDTTLIPECIIEKLAQDKDDWKLQCT